MPVPTDVGVGDEIAHLKARLAAAEEGRDAALRSNSLKRQATMPRTSGVRTQTDHIPPVPSLVPAELSQWLLDRQSDLQETLELGGPPDLVLQLTSMFSDGAVRMMEMNGGMVPDCCAHSFKVGSQRPAKNPCPRVVGRCISRRGEPSAFSP